jgi:small-conductance mechanosensitive channel
MPLAAMLVQEAPTGAVDLLSALDGVQWAPILRAIVMVLVGVPIALLASRWTRRWFSSRVSPQVGLLLGRIVLYSAFAILAISTLNELGFSLAPLLGAAGVLGIAIGFASQTSVSNIISGFFLIAERPFVVGDLIEVDGVTGRVLSIDSISVKLRTFDNKMVRMPNETLVKTRVTNITRFPIRRADVRVGVAYKEDASRVRTLLLDIAEKNPLALIEPEPVVVFEGFGDSSINFLFGVWATQENWLRVKNGIQEEIKARFDAEGIEIPFPHRTLFAGSASDPFPVRVVDDAREGPPPA